MKTMNKEILNSMIYALNSRKVKNMIIKSEIKPGARFLDTATGNEIEIEKIWYNKVYFVNVDGVVHWITTSEAIERFEHIPFKN